MTLKSVSLSSAMFLLYFSFIAVAQGAQNATQAAQPAAQGSQAVQPQAPAAEPPAKLILKEGTDVKLKFAQDLSSKTATDDDPVNLVLDEDLKVGDVTVAKAGAKALGTVTHATGTAVALTVLFGPIGLIKHGKNVEVKQGTALLAYVDQDFTVPTPK